MRTVQMSNYTVGEDCFEAIPEALEAYSARTVVLVGGTRALAAAAPGIKAALEGSTAYVIDTIVYGTDSTQSAIDALVANPAFRDADVAFAIGGGKAIDTVKTAAKELRKTVFTVPTICSNCSSATAIAVVYNDDHSLKGYAYPDAPAHIFINPAIIADAPEEYFWAGIGDALSKQPEVEYATSSGGLTHTGALGLALAHTCTEPLMTFGAQGLADVRANRATEAVLLAYIGDTEQLERYAAFNKKIGLPVTLAELDLDESHLPRIAELAQNTNEWKQGNPEPFTSEAFIEAIKAADAFGKNLA